MKTSARSFDIGGKVIAGSYRYGPGLLVGTRWQFVHFHWKSRVLSGPALIGGSRPRTPARPNRDGSLWKASGRGRMAKEVRMPRGTRVRSGLKEPARGKKGLEP